MDKKTFEQVEISKSLTEEKYKLLKENLEVIILTWTKNLFLLNSNNIEVKIEATDAIKNQTASSSYKPAMLDCGLSMSLLL